MQTARVKYWRMVINICQLDSNDAIGRSGCPSTSLVCRNNIHLPAIETKRQVTRESSSQSHGSCWPIDRERLRQHGLVDHHRVHYLIWWYRRRARRSINTVRHSTTTMVCIRISCRNLQWQNLEIAASIWMYVTLTNKMYISIYIHSPRVLCCILHLMTPLHN